jgi:hypothetical protein
VGDLIVASHRFFSMPRESRVLVIGGIAVTFALVAWLVAGRGRSGMRAALVVALAVALGFYGYFRVFQFAKARIGLHLPTVTLLSPIADDRLGATVNLLAHATDTPGALGPIAAVRSIEFWLYHPSFAEQHPGNHESKVILGSVAGPTPNDEYAATWTCVNPYTPPRDGDHSGGDGTRTYVLPNDGRPYSIQAHGLDDEWRAKPGPLGRSELVTVRFEPCKQDASLGAKEPANRR